MEEDQSLFNWQYVCFFLRWMEGSEEFEFDIRDSLLKAGFVCMNYNKMFDSNEVQLQFNLLTKLYNLLPVGITKTYTAIQIKYNLINKWKLQRINIPYIKSKSGLLELQTYLISPLAFHFQIASCLIENFGSVKKGTKINSLRDFYMYYKILNANVSIEAYKKTQTSTYLNENLGSKYSHGELIDFIDRLFDQYKHTQITIGRFRTIFYCFGSNIEEVGNVAFDRYIENRQTEKAWQFAIVDHLKSRYCFSEKMSNCISEKIFM